MAKVTTADVSGEVESRFESIKHGVEKLIDSVPDKAKDLRGSAMTGIDALGVQIKKHPVAALAIAFGIGFLAMRLIRR
ncbi:MAG: hypothetical protein ABI678_07620 [Kofleriaceae bacterium]